jgi:hypothetical protein
MAITIPRSVSSPSTLAQRHDAILVAALQLDGRGDIYGAHEVALRVQKLMPHAKVTFTVLKPRFTARESFLFADKEFVDISQIQQQEQWGMEEESSVLETLSTFKKIIVFPTYHDSLLPKEILDRGQDVIKLREYSVGSPKPGIVVGPTYTLGLNQSKGEKGVLLPDEWSEAIPPRIEDAPLKRLEHLKNVEPSLSNAILGREFSQEAVESFSESSKLYMGYFSQANVFFCFINALLMAKEGNLVICNTQNRPEDLMYNIEDTLVENGFGQINIIEFSDSIQHTTDIQILGDGKKTCTLIFRPLSAIEMDSMLRATEDEALTTGDLSPFKFMAYRKTILYDTRTQKHESAQAMIELASQFDPRFKTLLPVAFFGAEEPSQQVNVVALEKGMANFIMAMDQDPLLKQKWNSFIDEVFSKHDFTPQLAQILEKRIVQ